MTVPDLPGCVADGETIEEAIAEAHDTFKAWAMAEQQDRGELPVPISTAVSWCSAARCS